MRGVRSPSCCCSILYELAEYFRFLALCSLDHIAGSAKLAEGRKLSTGFQFHGSRMGPGDVFGLGHVPMGEFRRGDYA